VYQRTHPLLLTDDAVSVVVWSLRTGISESSLRWYLQNIVTRAPSMPILLVATHADEVAGVVDGDLGVPIDRIRSDFPQIAGDVIQVSSISGLNFDELKRRLVEATLALPHVKQLVPRSYVQLQVLLSTWRRERLECGALPVVTVSELLEYVHLHRGPLHSLSDRDVVLRGLNFLEAWGDVVYKGKIAPALSSRRDVGSTNDIVVLQPQWLGDMLACLVSVDPSRASAVRRGILDHRRLRAAWPAPMYPSALLRPLLGLLHRFNVACELFDSKGSSLECSLVPAMLPTELRSGSQTPDELLGAVAAGELEVGVTYSLPFVPPDFWSLLLVRCATMSIPESCTTAIAVVKHGDNRGVLMLSGSSNDLTVWCRGASPIALRGRVHEIIQGILSERFPRLVTAVALSALCACCRKGRALGSRLRRQVLSGLPCTCDFCDTEPPMELPVIDLVGSAGKLLDDALEAMRGNPASACLPSSRDYVTVLASRLVDEVVGSCTDRCPRLWVPVPRAATVPGLLCTVADNTLVWRPVCEKDGSWHVLMSCAATPGGRVRTSDLVNMQELWPLRQFFLRVCRVIMVLSQPVDPFSFRDGDDGDCAHTLSRVVDILSAMEMPQATPRGSIRLTMRMINYGVGADSVVASSGSGSGSGSGAGDGVDSRFASLPPGAGVDGAETPLVVKLRSSAPSGAMSSSPRNRRNSHAMSDEALAWAELTVDVEALHSALGGPLALVAQPGGVKSRGWMCCRHCDTAPEGNLTPSMGMTPLSPPPESTIVCGYFRTCEAFLRSLGLPAALFDWSLGASICYCAKCCTARGDERVYSRGDPPIKYVLPQGWARVGLKAGGVQAEANNAFSKWHNAFHGTRIANLSGILLTGQLAKAGDTGACGRALCGAASLLSFLAACCCCVLAPLAASSPLACVAAADSVVFVCVRAVAASAWGNAHRYSERPHSRSQAGACRGSLVLCVYPAQHLTMWACCHTLACYRG
jgi:hypothetical protein